MKWQTLKNSPTAGRTGISVIPCSSCRLICFILPNTSNISFQIVGIHIKPYANDIIKLIIDFWNKGSDSDTPFQNTIMMVVERLINALGGEFKTYIAQLIPLIMKVII